VDMALVVDDLFFFGHDRPLRAATSN